MAACARRLRRHCRGAEVETTARSEAAAQVRACPVVVGRMCAGEVFRRVRGSRRGRAGAGPGRQAANGPSYRVLLTTDIPRTAGRPGEGTTYQPGHRCRTGMFPGVPHSRLERRGLPPSGSEHQNGCLHVVECNGHGISLLAEEASSPYGATDRGRSSCPNQASHGSIRYASATRVRSNAPGRCSKLP